jgi:hypothetical protein
MRSVFTFATLVIGLVTNAVAPLQAQTCFRGRPLPECRSFWLLEPATP